MGGCIHIETSTFTSGNSPSAGKGAVVWTVRAYSGEAYCSDVNGVHRNPSDDALYT